jgi:DNA (cytosine-5)-methyltransferase 1
VLGAAAVKLLDLFCGAGGAAVGYHRAGFTDITGVDLAKQPRYPFRFVEGDALEFLAGVGPGDYDLIHASPPCQGYSRMRHLPWLKGREWPKLIGPVRAAVRAIGTPYVIENVEGAPLDGVRLCGIMFGLKLYRHRLFESSQLLMAPAHLQHREVIGAGRLLNDRAKGNANGFVSIIRGDSEHAKRAMGCEWMTRDEVCEAIPPDYTEFLGRQLLGVTP